jgi:hypothetical protein
MSQFDPHHIITEVALPCRLLRTLKALEAKEDGDLLFPVIISSWNANIISHFAPAILAMKDQMTIGKVSMQKKAVIDHAIGPVL